MQGRQTPKSTNTAQNSVRTANEYDLTWQALYELIHRTDDDGTNICTLQTEEICLWYIM